MFIIYGRKDELADDDWFGYMNCHNCGNDRKHIFKLLKRYPTLFFVKIPLGRVIKRYLVCTNCGANRVVKKKEYEEIKNNSSATVQKNIYDNKAPAVAEQSFYEKSNVTVPSEAIQSVADKSIVVQKALPEEKTEAIASENKKIDVSIKQKIIDNKARISVKKKESEESVVMVQEAPKAPSIEFVPAETIIKSEKSADIPKIESEIVDRQLKIVGGKPQIADKEYIEKSRERNIFIEAVAVVAVIVLFLFAANEMSYGRRTTITTTTTTTVNYTQTTEKHTTSLPFTKGVVVGNTYYNDWMNIAFELPENYTEVDEEFYRELEAATSDEYGMYFVSDETESVAIGFADISSHPDITEEEFAELAAKEVEKAYSSYGDAFSGGVMDYNIAGKTFKRVLVCIYFEDRSAYSHILVYKLNDRMCYINVIGGNISDNSELISSIKKLY